MCGEYATSTFAKTKACVADERVVIDDMNAHTCCGGINERQTSHDDPHGHMNGGHGDGRGRRTNLVTPCRRTLLIDEK